MIVVKVWCLPPGQSEGDLNCLHKAIVRAAVSVSDLCLQDENDMVCLLPPDLMEYGLGEEIIVEIDGLPNIPRKNLTVREQLAKRVGKSVLELYPKAKIKCSAREFNPSDGVWTSI